MLEIVDQGTGTSGDNLKQQHQEVRPTISNARWQANESVHPHPITATEYLLVTQNVAQRHASEQTQEKGGQREQLEPFSVTDQIPLRTQ